MLYNGADRPVSGDAEVLTSQGWVRIDEWDDAIQIAQWEHVKDRPGRISFGSARRVELSYGGEMVRMRGPSSELLCTIGHKIPQYSCRGNLRDVAAGDVKECGWAIPLAGIYTDDFMPPNVTRAVVMFQADGCVKVARPGKTRTKYVLGFTKNRKIERCRMLLRALGIPFKEYHEKQGKHAIRFYIEECDAPYWMRKAKQFGPWLLDLDPLVFIDELKHWDGCTDKRNADPGTSYSTCSKENAEWVQTMAALAGTRASIAPRDRNPKWNVNYRVHVHSSGARSWLKKGWTFKHEPSPGKVYCARTQTGYFLVRYNGTIQVTGNTGRWSGQGVQPHNFVRGYMKEMGERTFADKDDPERGEKQSVWETLLTRDELGDLDLEAITLIEGAPLPVLAKACRGALIASDNKELYAADFKAIEARKLAWMAGCASQLELFRSGGDPYVAMASAIYSIPVDPTDKAAVKAFAKEHKTERQLGKKAVLGLGYCLAADTLILTPRGWVRIDKVRDWDMLWDGQEWVHHRGLVCNGEKYVMNLDDTFPTMDHPVWCGGQFHHAEKVGADDNLRRRALELGAEALPLPDMSSAPAAASDISWLGADAGHRNIKSIWRIGARVAQLAATFARSAQRRISGTPPISQQCPKPITASGFSSGSPPLSVDATTLATHSSKIMEHAELKSTSNGIRIAPRSCAIFAPFLGGMIRLLKWIEKKMTATMSRAIFASRLGASNAATRAGRKEKVYDLIDAGPHHRYTILTRDGPMIVHNSMGWEKFQATVWNEEGIWLEDDFCKKVVNIYRKKQCPEMPVLWKAIEKAAIGAVQEGVEHYAGGDPVTGAGQVSYFVNGRFLHCRLPSGRLLAYLDPEVHERINYRYTAKNERGTPCLVTFQSKIGVPMSRVKRHAEQLAERQRKTLNGEQPETFLSPHLSFMGRHIVTKEWKRLGTHGGSLTENADQASSRDLLAEAMWRADQDARFDLLLSIHDEIIAEAPVGTCTVPEFEAMMSIVPPWARGMPIEAEGWRGPRLRK